jgi:divinyl protochlorophyllide a 8-vinyl-reductase
VGATATLGSATDARPCIGPNAIIRLQEALTASVGGDRARDLFERAGQGRYVAVPPTEMVDETDVTSLYTLLPSRLGSLLAAEVSGRAGMLTGNYLLAHRIPWLVQCLLRWLPAPFAATALIAAIKRHAWTFVGSGHFEVSSMPTLVPRVPAVPGSNNPGNVGGRRPRLLLRVGNCPICRGSAQSSTGCTYYAATFEQIFVALVHPDTQVRETSCQGMGASACVFEVSW